MVIPKRYESFFIDRLEPQNEEQKTVIEQMKGIFDWELEDKCKKAYEKANPNGDINFSRNWCKDTEVYDAWNSLREARDKKRQQRKWSLCLLGTTGSGKTTLACALANAYKTCVRKSNIEYETVATLTQKYKSNFKFEFLENLYRCDVLVIDELRNTNEFTEYNKAILEELLDIRYADNKITILVGNLKISQLKEMFDEHIISRLRTGIVIQMAGKDLREDLG